MQIEYVLGTFIKELKNRFLCEVNILGENVECYVPSSCHLSNFIDLNNKMVLLIPTNASNARTRYSLFAVPHKNSYILLNISIANRAIEENMHNRRFAYLGKRNNVRKENNICGYKCDLFIEDTNTIVEIKGIISKKTNVLFPTVYSERTIKQLKKLQELMKKGYNVCFFIVSLNPYVQVIEINKSTEFSIELKKCQELGMIVRGYSCKLVNSQLIINKQLLIK